MAPRDGTPAEPQHPESRSESESGSTDFTLPLYRKLLLTAAMMASEICVSFEILYEVPLLQILGIPETFVSLYPVISGPAAMALITVLGCIIDKGPRHRQRKVIAVGFGSALNGLGAGLLIVANSLLPVNHDAGTNSTIDRNATTLATHRSYLADESVTNLTDKLLPENVSQDNSPLTSRGQQENDVSLYLAEEAGLSSLPVTAILGVAGFCFMDIGFDVSVAMTRACVLACSATRDHRSILVLCLVMSAVGGCFNNAIGAADLAHSLRLGAEEGLAAQTTVQLVVCCLFLIVCTTATMVTALLNISRLDANHYVPLKSSNTAKERERYGTFDHQLCAAADSTEENDGKVEEASQQSTKLIREHSAGDGISRVLLEDATCSRSPETQNQHDSRDEVDRFSDSKHGGFATVTCSKPASQSLLSLLMKPLQCIHLDKRVVNNVVACSTLFLGSSTLYSYNAYSGDFLGKSAFGGDPSAPPGSAEKQAYESGLRLAATGLLVMYLCYVIFTSSHNKLLECLGLKVDFCLTNVLVATSILCLTLSKEVTFLYVTNVFFALQKSALLTVPFIIVNSYVQEQTPNGADGSMVGKMMGAVTCMIPLNYCTLFLISGPLVTLTQHDGAPLLLASASSYMAVLIFLMYTP